MAAILEKWSFFYLDTQYFGRASLIALGNFNILKCRILIRKIIKCFKDFVESRLKVSWIIFFKLMRCLFLSYGIVRGPRSRLVSSLLNLKFKMIKIIGNQNVKLNTEWLETKHLKLTSKTTEFWTEAWLFSVGENFENFHVILRNFV